MQKLHFTLIVLITAVIVFVSFAFLKATETPTKAEEPYPSTILINAALPDIPVIYDIQAADSTLLVPAVRVDPPIPMTTLPSIIPGPDGTTVSGRCTQYEPLLAQLAPSRGWDISKMSRTMWRESNCRPDVRSTTRDSGLLQINDINHKFLREVLGVWVDRYTLLDPTQNIQAAARLCDYWRDNGGTCYTAWNGGA